MSLTFYMTASLAAFLRAQQPSEVDSNRRERGWMLVAWSAAALGVLTKGLVAAAIPAAVLVLYCLLARDLSPWRRLHAAPGIALFLAITVPWHWLTATRLPDFLEFFFVHEHFSRYLTPSADREEAWWFYAAVFALGSIPWTLSALRVVATGWRRRAVRGRFDPTPFLWIWTVFICVFFSFSDSKLVPYVLPAMPGLALLIGASPANAFRRDVWLTALFTVAAAAAAAAAGLGGPRSSQPRSADSTLRCSVDL
jgi:4-amino-4-deoxy-L-arabinose transferase-like glycosyltransferase